MSNRKITTISRRQALAGGLGLTLSGLALPNIARAQATTAKLPFKLSVLKGSVHSFLPLVALNNDFFGKNGLEVEVVNTMTGPAFISSVQSGSAEGGITAFSLSLPTEQKGGKRMTAVAGDLGIASYGMIVRPEVADRFKGDWKQIVQALRGLRFAVPAIGGEVAHVFFGLLKAAGVDQKELTVVQTGPFVASVAALKRGDIDGFINPSYPQQLGLQKQGVGKVVLDLKNAEPFKKWQQTAFFVAHDLIEKKPEVVKRVQATMKQSHAWMQDPANFPAALKIVNEIFPTGEDEARDLISRFRYEIDREGTERNIDFFVESGVIKEKKPYEYVVIAH